MPEPASQQDVSAIEALKREIARGRRDLGAGSVKRGHVELFVGNMRGRLRAMFGADSAALAAWPAGSQGATPENASEVLAERIGMAVDAQFRHAFAHRLAVGEVAGFQAGNAGCDTNQSHTWFALGRMRALPCHGARPLPARRYNYAMSTT